MQLSRWRRALIWSRAEVAKERGENEQKIAKITKVEEKFFF